MMCVTLVYVYNGVDLILLLLLEKEKKKKTIVSIHGVTHLRVYVYVISRESESVCVVE